MPKKKLRPVAGDLAAEFLYDVAELLRIVSEREGSPDKWWGPEITQLQSDGFLRSGGRRLSYIFDDSALILAATVLEEVAERKGGRIDFGGIIRGKDRSKALPMIDAVEAVEIEATFAREREGAPISKIEAFERAAEQLKHRMTVEQIERAWRDWEKITREWCKKEELKPEDFLPDFAKGKRRPRIRG